MQCFRIINLVTIFLEELFELLMVHTKNNFVMSKVSNDDIFLSLVARSSIHRKVVIEIRLHFLLEVDFLYEVVRNLMGIVEFT